MQFDFKKLIPHLIAIGVFIVIVFLYFSPLMEGKRIEQHDILQWEGMSKEIRDFRDKTGKEALWTNSMFGGMPAYQISTVYPANMVQYVNSILWLGMPDPASLVFLCLLGFYLLLISVKVDYRLSIAGAIAYTFCSYNFIVIAAGHNSKIHAMAYIPMVIAGVLMCLRGRIWLGAAITGLSLALQLYANHLQITYYSMILIFMLVIFESVNAFKNKKVAELAKAGAALLVMAIIAVLTSVTSIWSTYEYGKYSTRSQSELTEKKVSTGLDKDYVFGWSYGKLESFTLLIPGFMGGATQSDIGTNSATYKALQKNGAGAQANSFVSQAPLYWGDQPSTAGPTYLGAITVFLFVLALFIVNTFHRWWLLAAAVLFLFLSWGKNFEIFNDFFFFHFPGYNKFRSVSMAMVITNFSVALLAFLGMKRFFSGELKPADLKKPLLYSFYITGGLCLFFTLIAGIINMDGAADEGLKQYDWLLAALKEDRVTTLRMDALRSLFFISAAFALLWFGIQNKLKREYAFIGLALLFLLDMWPVNKRYLSSDHFVSKSKAANPFQPSPANQRILADKTLGFRVMNTTVSTFNDASTSYFHHSIGGYHGAKLKRYQELIENQISKQNMNVLNMLNTKYFIVQDQQGGAPMAQVNPAAAGPAWFVSEFKIVANADSEITALTGFNPLQTAIVDKRYESYLAGFNPQPDSAGKITFVSYEPNYLVYDFTAANEQFVIFSEIFYDKGWNAYVDGAKMPHIRVNYVLRGMRVPAGRHKIEFRFEPDSYITGEKIALASSGLLLLAFMGILVMEVKKLPKAVEKPVAPTVAETRKKKQ